RQLVAVSKGPLPAQADPVAPGGDDVTRRLSRLRQELRQRRHHRAFRIAPPLWDEPLLDELERLLAAVAPAEPDGPAPKHPGAGDRAESEDRPQTAPAGSTEEAEASGNEPSTTVSAQSP